MNSAGPYLDQTDFLRINNEKGRSFESLDGKIFSPYAGRKNMIQKNSFRSSLKDNLYNFANLNKFRDVVKGRWIDEKEFRHNVHVATKLY